MKLSPLLFASAAVLAGLALSAEGASAATNLNTSRSNIYKIDPNDPNAGKSCTDGGGKLSTDKAGNKICTKPESASKATNLNSSKSN